MEKEISPCAQLEQLLQQFVSDMKKAGVSFIGLNLEVGREHFSPDRRIHCVEGETPFDFQEFEPAGDISATVLLRARD
ncbi:hypothetical protein ACFOTA_06970 [Chitinophaga sp. GCM10012297]|uniref:Uncharacterized protein n=1 Tax=Chitinophaga chungangae TaxID=2821488 RepID=A0ABS3YB89_9BACT|nr:hypothetical protein [Chitinophaga chungangae]MBO9151941.1 hypothetical protein [Chitinophaga chungangae]